MCGSAARPHNKSLKCPAPGNEVTSFLGRFRDQNVAVPQCLPFDLPPRGWAPKLFVWHEHDRDRQRRKLASDADLWQRAAGTVRTGLNILDAGAVEAFALVADRESVSGRADRMHRIKMGWDENARTHVIAAEARCDQIPDTAAARTTFNTGASAFRRVRGYIHHPIHAGDAGARTLISTHPAISEIIVWRLKLSAGSAAATSEPDTLRPRRRRCGARPDQRRHALLDVPRQTFLDPVVPETAEALNEQHQ